MSRPLREILKYNKNGKILKPVAATMIYNVAKSKTYQSRDLRVAIQDDNIYIYPFINDDIVNKFTKEDLVDNFIVITEAEDKASITSFTEKDIKNENYAILLDYISITKDTHPFNIWLIRYLKENFHGRLITKNRKDVRDLLNVLTKSLDQALTHRKVEKLFSLISTDYATFLDWISNLKAVKIKDLNEFKNNENNGGNKNENNG